jgi:uncharacterized repeat protein (TIGR01451 family)
MSVKWFASTWAMLLSIVVFALAAGCSQTAPSDPEPTSGVTYTITIKAPTPASLPACTPSLRGQVAFVSSPASLWVCDNGNHWRPIPCNDGNVGAVAFASTNDLLVACIAKQWIPVPVPSGPPGPTGPMGDAGLNSLIRLTDLPPGNVHCMAGGTEIQVGVDTNGDGMLENGEVQQTTFICNGTSATTPSADLAIVASTSDPTPNVGDTVTLTFGLSNLGPQDATGVTVSALLPAGLTLVFSTPSQGSYAPATGLWVVGSVPAGATPTLTIGARVVTPSTQTVTASVAHSDQADPTASNNVATVSVSPQQADLSISATASNSAPNVGDTILLTITASNLGPQSATGVTVSAPLPAGLAFVSATLSQGTYVGTTGVWTLGAMSAGTVQTLVLTVRVVSPSSQTLTASISHSDQFDPSTLNNSASVSVSAQQADLSVSATTSNSAPNVGDTVTLTITVSNAGPSDASNVAVSVALPPSVSFVSATTSQGSFNSSTGVWTVGALPVSTTPTLSVRVVVVATPGTATVSISHSDQFDPNPAGNSVTVTI